MIPDEIIRKIKSALRLSASDNEHEAANALSQARKLMDKHQVTDNDLLLSSVGESSATIRQRTRRPGYLIGLANTVASIMGCEIFLLESRGPLKVTFVGVTPNDELAAYAFDTLAKNLTAARKHYQATELRFVRLKSNKIRRADVYCVGWVLAIASAVQSLKVIVPEVVGQYLAEKSGDMVPSKSRPTKLGNNQSDLKDMSKGHQDGEQIDINKPITGHKQLAIECAQ